MKLSAVYRRRGGHGRPTNARARCRKGLDSATEGTLAPWLTRRRSSRSSCPAGPERGCGRFSRDSPKHLIQLIGSQTLFAQAALRATDRKLFGPLTVIAGAPHRFMIAEQLREIGISDATIVLEPMGRNATAAAAVAALVVTRNAPDAVLLVMPADHLIDEARFRRAISAAMPAARRGFLTLFGIKPVSPATGYGYIRTGAELSNAGGARLAAGFVEKPDRETAETYLQSGESLEQRHRARLRRNSSRRTQDVLTANRRMRKGGARQGRAGCRLSEARRRSLFGLSGDFA